MCQAMARDTLSVYRVRLWLALTMTIMLVNFFFFFKKQAERYPMLQVT